MQSEVNIVMSMVRVKDEKLTKLVVEFTKTNDLVNMYTGFYFNHNNDHNSRYNKKIK